MQARLKRSAFAAGLALFGLLLIELALQLLALASGRVHAILASPADPAASAPILPDVRLEFRPNPALRGHDARGFRNPRVLERAEIVALGDSQTYGTGVGGEEAWPRVLEQLTGRTTYSMAAGGYGPVHELMLLDEALALRPEVVIEALYAGNDLYDAWRIVYVGGQYPELRSDDALQAVSTAEARESLARRVERIQKICMPPPAAPAAEEPGHGALRTWLASSSKLYGLLRRIAYELAAPSAAADPDVAWQAARGLAARSESCQAFEAGGARTLLTPDYRLTGLDLADPRILEGERIALRALGRMHAQVAQRGVRFVVLLIPTKELVFSRLEPAPSPSLARLLEHERHLWSDTREFLRTRGIEFIEVEAALQDQLERGPQPYPVSSDGHPNAIGQRVIAQQVADHLAQAPRQAPLLQ